MRIIEATKFHYFRRGTSRHYFDLIAALERHGHEVASFSMRSKEMLPSRWEKYFVSYVGYNENDSNFWQRVKGVGRLFWSFEARRKMAALIRDFRPEVVHVHGAYHQLSLAFFPMVKRMGLPLIMTVHDYAMISPDKDAYYPEVGKRYWKFLLIKKYGFGKRLLLVIKKYWEDWYGFYDYVDRFIVPSRYVESVLLSARVKKEKMIVMLHFISDTENQSETVKDAVLPPQYLFYFGAISKVKGVETLLRLSAALNMPLLLAGRFESGPDLKKYPQVSYLGMRTKGELNTLIARATAVVGATKSPEPFGLTTLETIALGKPYFALATGALSEIIQSGFNGFLASDEKELEEVLRAYIQGTRTYASEEDIRRDAKERFGEEAYIRKFEDLPRFISGKSLCSDK